ncbi:MAG: hypothetical protein LBT01_07060 [Spirochaetaceae bacterium]|nr:hypothetical protein [Spirochaetaceae bacterium]
MTCSACTYQYSSCFFSFFFGGLYVQEALDAEARVKEITEEASPALFSMSIPC